MRTHEELLQLQQVAKMASLEFHRAGQRLAQQFMQLTARDTEEAVKLADQSNTQLFASASYYGMERGINWMLGEDDPDITAMLGQWDEYQKLQHEVEKLFHQLPLQDKLEQIKQQMDDYVQRIKAVAEKLDEDKEPIKEPELTA